MGEQRFVLQRERSSFSAVIAIRFGKYAAHVLRNGVLANEKLLRNLMVCFALRNQL